MSKQPQARCGATHRRLRAAQVPAAHVAALLQVVGGHRGALHAPQVLQLVAVGGLQGQDGMGTGGVMKGVRQAQMWSGEVEGKGWGSFSSRGWFRRQRQRAEYSTQGVRAGTQLS